ncbi:MAG: ADP-glyceromanno-heptose 6-epimerase [Bacteroidetes bacterium]|nr:ADP-glyceromanno-heptose 6-epimerase [Bacteroidota bacterium]
MQIEDNIAITGAAGFIGSYLAGYLNQLGYDNLILIDDFSDERKAINNEGRQYLHKIERNQFFDWYADNPGSIQYMFHLGARTDTTEPDYEIFRKLNLEYSKKIWELCTANKIPLVYASSAATYGNGEHGYSDRMANIADLKPLNPYAVSKQEFDLWALAQKTCPPTWAGIKFFNVYGPNEYHKGRMASVVYHAYKQIKEKGEVKLFRSHNPDYKDGEQMRDFIYVRDVARICVWLMVQNPGSGLYNAGTGKARTFKDLVKAIFKVLQKPENITYIDTPEDIRDKYQYFTEADMGKFLESGYDRPFCSIEEGIREYVLFYLERNNCF